MRISTSCQLIFSGGARFVLPGLLLMFMMASRPAHAQLYYLDLSRQTIAVANRAVHVEQVLDGRKGQPPIGAVYRGLNNKPAVVLFRQGIGPELTAWLQQQLPRRAPDHAVVLCLRQLRVSEVMNGMTELASAEVAADVYEHQPDGYHFVRSVADHVSSRALESTGLHAPHLAHLLQSCLEQLTDVAWATPLPGPARTLAQLTADNPLATNRPAILRTARPRRGLYYTFGQFLANQPDTTAQLRLDTLRSRAAGWEGTLLLRPHAREATGSRVALRDVWGFSDGHQAYLNQRNIFRPMVRQGAFFTFVGTAPLDAAALSQRSQNYAAAGGGALGALAASAASGPDDHSGQPMVFALDMRTGQAAPLLRPGQPQQPDTAYVYVYRPAGGPATAQRLMLNDHEVGQLRPGEYLELTWPYYGHPVRLSLGTPDSPALLLVPNAATANYVKLRPGTTFSTWQWVPGPEGEADVDALDKRRK